MKRIIVITTILSLIFASCEDVIEIDLKSIEPQLVVEGFINDFDEQCTIKLTKTDDYFKPTNYESILGATISISENNSANIYFEDKGNGIYLATNLKGKENTGYTLTITTEGKEYIANVTIPQKVELDSVSYTYEPPTPRDDEGYFINCHFIEPAEYTNYYRLKAYNINDTIKAKGSFFVFDDKLLNGNNTTMPYRFETFQLNDTVIVELLGLDKSTYDFYTTLSEIAGNGGPPMGGSTPSNPESNLSNNALGNFSAYTLSVDTIIIKGL